MLRWLGYAVILVVACGSGESGTISVTIGTQTVTGCATDTFTRDPAVVTVDLDTLERGGAPVLVKHSAYPDTSAIDLGEIQQTLVASLQLVGKDAAGDAVVFGSTPFAEIGAFNGLTVPLFVQRRGEFACMPGAIADARANPLLAVTSRSINYAGGSLAGTTTPLPLSGYDLLMLNDLKANCIAPDGVTSFAFVTLTNKTTTSDGDPAVEYFVSKDTLTRMGAVTCLSFSNFTIDDAGDAFSKVAADIAGGATVMGDDGTAYIVGQTKTDSASGTMLILQPSLIFDVTTPSTARLGAAAAWAPGRGVFLYGGSATAAGVEIVAESGTSTTVAFPPDVAQNLAAIAFDSNKSMLIAGDAAPARIVDLTCPSGCTPQPWGQNLPETLGSPKLFSLGKSAFLIVGEGASGTVAYRMSDTAVTKVPLKIARKGARAIQIETGQIVVIGGGSATPESYAD